MSKESFFKVDDCVFCGRIERGEYEFEQWDCVVFEPLNPVTPGHLLIVPKVHSINAASNHYEAAKAAQLAFLIAGETKHDFNVITSIGPRATQTVFHTHIHLVPRRDNDGLKLPWTDQKKD